MTRACEYYGVQMAQSEYLLLWEKQLQRDIVARTFVPDEDISVNYYGYKTPVSGREAVKTYFDEVYEDTVKNGSVLRNDMPETQVITVSEDGQTAVGRWLTMTGIIEGPAYGNTETPYPYNYYIGIYNNTYVKQPDGRWKVKTVDWKPIISFGEGWTMSPETSGGIYYKHPEYFPAPFVPGVVEDSYSPKTEAKIACRLAMTEFAQDFVKNGVAAVTPARFTRDCSRKVKVMLDGTKPGFHGALMLTSPIGQVNFDCTKVDMFYNTMLVKNTGRDTVTASKGRICASFEKQGDNWRCTAFEWYPYATLVPWKLNQYWPEHI